MIKSIVFAGGKAVVISDSGARVTTLDPMAIEEVANEISEDESMYIKCLQGEVGSLTAKEIDDFINLAEVPANGRVVRITVGQKAPWLGIDEMSPQLAGLLGNELDADIYSGSTPVNIDLAYPAITSMHNIKETEATMVRFKVTTASDNINVGDKLLYWIEYLQE